MAQQTAAAAAAVPAADRSFVDETVQYVLKNKLKTVLYTWAGGISACLVSGACAAWHVQHARQSLRLAWKAALP